MPASSSIGGRARRPARAAFRAGLSAEELKKNLLGARMVRCDEAAWKMWDISMAGWNAILSGGLAFVLSGVAIW